MSLYNSLTLDVQLFNEEEEPELYSAVIGFNELYNTVKEISSMDYYELFNAYKLKYPSEPIPLSNWKLFRLDHRVGEWYDEELKLTLISNLHKISHKAGLDKSTATQQTLKGLLDYFYTEDTKKDANKIFVYTLIPLNYNEMKNDNVRIVEHIPKEISDAITRHEIKKTKTP